MRTPVSASSHASSGVSAFPGIHECVRCSMCEKGRPTDRLQDLKAGSPLRVIMMNPITTNPHRLLLADKRMLVTQSIGMYLSFFPEFTIVGRTAHYAELPGLISAQQPHLVVVGDSLEDIDGVAACEALRATFPDIRLAFHCTDFVPARLAQALLAGVSGTLPMSGAPSEFVDALRLMLAGEFYLAHETAVLLVRRLSTTPGIDQIDPAERAVLEGFADPSVEERLTSARRVLPLRLPLSAGLRGSLALLVETGSRR